MSELSELNVEMLADRILQQFKTVLSAQWKHAKYYAEQQSQQLAECLADITEQKLKGEIDEQQARLYLDTQKQATLTALTSLVALRIESVNKAIDTGLSAVRTIVNTAIKCILL